MEPKNFGFLGLGFGPKPKLGYYNKEGYNLMFTGYFCEKIIFFILHNFIKSPFGNWTKKS